jgi:hypothetical protein
MTTSPPPNLFDYAAAQSAKAEAIARVDAHADDDWATAARRAVGWLALTQYTFTTDDVWHALEGRTEATHEPRALGAVMKRVASLGYCEPTEQWQQSSRPDCHGRPVRVWRSLFGPTCASPTVVSSEP